MRRFSEIDKHYDRHNEGICAVCGCTTERWKSVCDSCRNEAVQELIKKEELKEKETEMSDLKPCPFCGGDVQLYNIDDDGLGGFSYYYEVVCRHCGLSNKSIYANRDRVENATIKHWNTRPIEDALRKEIAQLKKDKLELNAQCFHKDETISVLKNRITELEFDNRSLVEQMNKMVHIGTN